MRALVVMAAVGLAGAGIWWLLRPSPEPDSVLDVAGPLRPSGSPVVVEGPALEVARVGLPSPRDRGMVADPQAEPWENFILHFQGAADVAVTGAELLTAIGERLYVRTKTQQDLDAFRAQTFEGVVHGVDVPLGVAKQAIEQGGWRVAVSDPRFVFFPATGTPPTPVPKRPPDAGR